MKRILYIFILNIFILFSFSCSEENEGPDFSLEGPDISITDLEGRWEATKAVFSKTDESPAVEFDIIADGGYMILEIYSGGAFNVTYTIPNSGLTPIASDGVMGFEDDLFALAFDDSPDDYEYYSITYNEPNLSIYSGGIVYEAYDFNGDGELEDAYIDLEFERILGP